MCLFIKLFLQSSILVNYHSLSIRDRILRQYSTTLLLSHSDIAFISVTNWTFLITTALAIFISTRLLLPWTFVCCSCLTKILIYISLKWSHSCISYTLFKLLNIILKFLKISRKIGKNFRMWRAHKSIVAIWTSRTYRNSNSHAH